MIDFRNFIKNAEAVARRYPYDCADAINILYVINKLPKSYSGRMKYAKALQLLQNPETGLFAEDDKYSFYITAKYVSALNLLDSHPVYELNDMLCYKEFDALYNFMENQPWSGNPCLASHNIAALYSSLTLNEDADYEWQEKYLNWLWDNTDGDTGLIRQGFINYRKTQPMQYLVGMFRYICSFEYKHLPIRYPSRLIDTCIQIHDRTQDTSFGKKISYDELSWIYCLSRAMRQTDYRFKDCKERLINFENKYTDYLLSIDFSADADLHKLFCALCTIAELQSALPGTILTEKPLSSILNRHPII